MLKIGIICAMWAEARLLYEEMKDVRETECSGMKYYEGRLQNTEAVLFTCGVGKVNAALYTQLLIDRFRVDVIVHTGIAGSMDETVRHLDLVIAQELTYYDVRKEQMAGCFPNQTVFKADEKIRDILMECAKKDARQGLILTGDCFVSDRRQKDALKREFPTALCVEMEGCAVAHTAFVNGVPFGVIRCISDLADGEAAADYRNFEEKAAYRAAGIVKRAAAALAKEPERRGAKAAPGVRIRIAVPEDAEALLKIYGSYVEKTAVTFEYEVPSAAEFAERIRRTLKKYPYLAAEQDGEIIGYAYAGTFHERAAYDWAVETSIYVRQDKKGAGIGRALYHALEQALLRQNILNVNACIAYPAQEDEYLTKDSVFFHKKLGYRMAGEFYDCGYKFGRWYHMVWMEKHLGIHPEKPEKVIWFSELNRL